MNKEGVGSGSDDDDYGSSAMVTGGPTPYDDDADGDGHPTPRCLWDPHHRSPEAADIKRKTIQKKEII